MERIDATVLTDSLEIWEVTNAQNATHNTSTSTTCSSRSSPWTAAAAPIGSADGHAGLRQGRHCVSSATLPRLPSARLAPASSSVDQPASEDAAWLA